jgi:hypothetical protein
MSTTTRAQRLALMNVFRRCALTIEERKTTSGNQRAAAHAIGIERRIGYREFRKLAQPTFGCDGAIAVPWCGMWLAIERDGYVHS